MRKLLFTETRNFWVFRAVFCTCPPPLLQHKSLPPPWEENPNPPPSDEIFTPLLQMKFLPLAATTRAHVCLRGPKRGGLDPTNGGRLARFLSFFKGKKVFEACEKKHFWNEGRPNPIFAHEYYLAGHRTCGLVEVWAWQRRAEKNPQIFLFLRCSVY